MKNKILKNPEAIAEKNSKTTAKKEVDKITVENHKKAAEHLMEAAKHHLDAAKHHEAGNHKRAAQSTVLAYGHHAIAGDFLTDDAKRHAQTLKVTNYHV